MVVWAMRSMLCMKYEYLSFPLGINTPVYRNNPPVSTWSFTSTARGDPANQFFLQTLNHNGTHIDGPFHFNPEGKSLYELAAGEFIFSSVGVVELKKDADELITGKELQAFTSVIASADLLLLKTGFGACRKRDPELFCWHNPGFAGSAGKFLMEFPSLKAVGFDFPSAAAAAHREEGILFHKTVLGAGRSDEKAILIIEDMDLGKDLSGIEKVFALPLLIEGADSGPATIIAEFRETF